MPNTNSKRFGRIKGQVNSALKDALGNVLTSTYITNVTYDDETGTLYFWSGNTLKYSCVIEAPAPDLVTAPLYLLGVEYDPEDPETESVVDITVPSGADVYLYSRDFGQTWRRLSQGTNHFELYGLTDHISLKIQADRTVTFSTSNYLQISTFGKVEAYNNVNSLLSPNFATLTDLTTVAGSGAYCFYNLFYQCSGLIRAPLLPAATLANSCYRQMFDGCTSLSEVRIAATNISASNCLNNWLNNVAATGDFYCVNGVSYPSGASGIPSGWQVHI